MYYLYKNGLEILKNQNQFYASVATFALLAVIRITAIHTVFRVHRIFPHVQQNRFPVFHLTFFA